VLRFRWAEATVPHENLEMFERMGVILLHNFRWCSFLLRHSSQICLRSSIRALHSSWRTWQRSLENFGRQLDGKDAMSVQPLATIRPNDCRNARPMGGVKRRSLE